MERDGLTVRHVTPGGLLPNPAGRVPIIAPPRGLQGAAGQTRQTVLIAPRGSSLMDNVDFAIINTTPSFKDSSYAESGITRA